MVEAVGLAALSPVDRETILYTLREEAGVASHSGDAGVMAGFEALARLVEASGLVAGKCRICGCTEERACSIVTPGSDVGAAAPGLYGSRACGWADQTQTLCDAPNCLAAAARRESAARAVDETLGREGPGPFPPSSGLTRGGRAEAMPVVHSEEAAIDRNDFDPRQLHRPGSTNAGRRFPVEAAPQTPRQTSGRGQ